MKLLKSPRPNKPFFACVNTSLLSILCQRFYQDEKKLKKIELSVMKENKNVLKTFENQLKERDLDTLSQRTVLMI